MTHPQPIHQASLPGARPVDAMLTTVHRLVADLEGAGIRYCHWKSNEHLGASMSGLTDLDVLVERGRDGDLQQVLARTGFRRFQAAGLAGYPAVEDYLAVDPPTGRLVHLHLHYRLTLGQKYLKGHRLPWEEETLAMRRRDAEYGIHVAAPEIELLLLVVRDALKRRMRTVLADLSGRRGGPGDFHREFHWLVERADLDAVAELGERLIGPRIRDTLGRLLESGARAEDRRAFAARVRPALRDCRTYGPVSATLHAAIREGVWLAGGLSRRRFRWPLALRRVSPRGGVVVAFLGSDGSGKSSLSADTIAWLGAKLDVVPIYFGSGDGPGSLLRAPMQLARRLLARVPARQQGGDGAGHGRRSRMRGVVLVPWALSLSLEKRTKLRRMIRARNRGLVVICDRFPQDQVEGFNDGRLLGHLAGSRWRLARAIARWEAKPYTIDRLHAPDLAIKLVASPGTALSRRPEMSIAEIERRIDVVRGLRFPAGTNVAEIDADSPFDEVVLSVRQQIWESL